MKEAQKLGVTLLWIVASITVIYTNVLAMDANGEPGVFFYAVVGQVTISGLFVGLTLIFIVLPVWKLRSDD